MDFPIIDLRDGFDEHEQAEKLRTACEVHGFFLIKGLPMEQCRAVMEQSKAFFRLPMEDKMKLVEDDAHGYVPFGKITLDPIKQKVPDTRELWALGAERYENMNPDCEAYGYNRWPSAELLPDFKTTMLKYNELMHDTCKKLNHLIAIALDLPADYFDGMFGRDTISALRPVHYSEQLSDPENGRFGTGEHSDWGMTTILLTDGNQGLQVKLDGVWTDIKEPEGTLICNIGDMLERWTNRRFKSTMHRVVNKRGVERFSVPFFLNPRPEVVISSLPTCGTSDIPDIECGEYIVRRHRECGEPERDSMKIAAV
mmetsp:Transcript_44767/g.173698  ORF Transcript_44767/g.173698 Transcript_44767/m.173698 type:complete len:312 (-) Transcript_44767:1925-2860(-)|eukprot:CAMPEP_0113956032 /NCGR_PEP_ID=MMETSP0011_2-20120614/1794_1 /TAXON_ID=101924 /ORGANISM="Rhodosorus marinus" /LENGTH=311 /DNA_ID=CAMNT_0000966049 /DNA_START=49 /DNA_END=984 /DNA_ORIENTATION=+ /assembly_acc=CAM_ASM_000156